MKDYSRAVDAYQKALDIDPTNEEAGLGAERCLMVRLSSSIYFLLF